MAEYSRAVLKVTVAQMCQTVGWQSVHTSPLEVMVDLLDEYLRQLAHISHNYAEVLGRTDVNLDDVGLIFQHMNIDLSQLADYVENAGSIPCVIQVPKFPLPREDHLNFMDLESRKICTRPMYVPEYFPPMYSNFKESPSDEKKVIFENDENLNSNKYNQPRDVMKRPGDSLFEGFASDKRAKLSTETEFIKKVHSVEMTTSGFLSPVCEGKLPELRAPAQIHEESYEEPEISIIDEPMWRYKNENSLNVILPVTESPKLTINTEHQPILNHSPYYLHSLDELILPRTPDFPEIPEIKISKVESLANLPEERQKWSENSVITEPQMLNIFDIFPVSNGPGLMPYSIHPIPNLFQRTQSGSKKKQVANTKKQPQMNKVQSCGQSDLFPDLRVDSTGKYSVISDPSPVDSNSAPEKLGDEKKFERSRKNKSKKDKHAEKSEKRKEDKEKEKKDGVTIVYPLEIPARKSSAMKPVKKLVVDDKEDKNIVSKMRIKAPSNVRSTTIVTSGNRKTLVGEKKKSRAGAVERRNSNKFLAPGHAVKKVTFKLPEIIDEAAGSNLEVLPPIVKKKIKSAEAKKTSKAVTKGKKMVAEEVPVFTPKYGPNGERIWICPACGRVDSGTPMIGCDDCDDWYHWVCIGMRVPPPREANWYCRPCLAKKRRKGTGGNKKNPQGYL